MLHQAGLDLGTNLLGAGPSNPYGHFEDIDVIATHDAALAAHNLTWKHAIACPRPAGTLAADIASFVHNRQTSATPGSIWGVKDPRLCLFLPEWLAADPDAHVVAVVRRPGAAIASLHRRHARRYIDTRRVDPTDLAFWKDPDLGLRLWIHYYEQLIASLPANAYVIDFDDRSAIEQLPSTVARLWNLPLRANEHTSLDPALGLSGGDAIEVRDLALISAAEELWVNLPFSSNLA